ncbi:uncharacterized protein At5g39865-like [Carica papaya]|uniref:uncharacterized protein At5g39865-like n=1 Tax=Carica papaya TaxID=3649 RepID=UPI000B8CE8A0|nr:uncharacterized protein At5g39865-like [Carica papaya]
MGCVSSNLLNQDDEFGQLGSSALSHHIVSLTSTTYGLLTLDPPPQSEQKQSPSSDQTTPLTPPQRFTFGTIFPTPLAETKSVWSESRSLWSEPKLFRSEPEVINSWELMSGLDTDSFRFSPIPKTPTKPVTVSVGFNKENANPNLATKPLNDNVLRSVSSKGNHNSLERFEKLCPPNGEAKVVIYTTTLRGIRRTFEACNAVRAAVESFGVSICERDVSMDRGFKQELRDLMKGKEIEAVVPPRVFVKGRYVGGAEEVMRIVEEGWFGDLVHGLPKKRALGACDGCGGVGFLPCFACNGSCKVVQGRRNTTVVIRCTDCNENGLVLCPICS